MATMSVSLPDPMKEWVDTRARSGRYSDVSDYVRDLIRRDQERADRIADLQMLVSEGIESGVSGRSRDEIARMSREMAASSRQR